MRDLKFRQTQFIAIGFGFASPFVQLETAETPQLTAGRSTCSGTLLDFALTTAAVKFAVGAVVLSGFRCCLVGLCKCTFDLVASTDL